MVFFALACSRLTGHTSCEEQWLLLENVGNGILMSDLPKSNQWINTAYTCARLRTRVWGLPRGVRNTIKASAAAFTAVLGLGHWSFGKQGPIWAPICQQKHICRIIKWEPELEGWPPHLIINQGSVQGTQSDESAVCQAKLSLSITPLLLLV